jgi:hypothetical protein
MTTDSGAAGQGGLADPADGWSSIAIAQAYPMVRVDGFDLDPDVIAAAVKILSLHTETWRFYRLVP